MKPSLIPTDIRQQAAYWLAVAPVHLIADRDTLVLAPSQHLALSLDEAQALALSFNTHFAEDHYYLWVVSEQQWMLGSSHPWRLKFPSLQQAESHNCRDAWQQGHDAQAWRRLLNEAQMLWFSHDVNMNREAQGQLTVNGMWTLQARPWWRRWFAFT